MKLSDVLVPTYIQMLKALSAWLRKAELQMTNGAAERLLSARLAPDMFPLSTQVRFACVQAQEGICSLQFSLCQNLMIVTRETRQIGN